MSRTESTIRYVPGIVPGDVQSLPQFLADELYRIATSIERPQKFAVQLYGVCPPILVANEGLFGQYPDLAAWDGGQSDWANALAGTITVPFNSVWTVSGWAAGSLSAPTQNNSIALFVDVNSTRFYLQSTDVASVQTAFRAWHGSFTIGLNAGDILALGVEGSAGMGTFTPEAGTMFKLENDF
jgi:hypothetical protein